MRFSFFFFFFVCSLMFAEDKSSTQFSYQRVFEKAEKDLSWSKLSLREKLMKVRAVALKNKTVSEPVSDRYQITAYGGPIDLVHFLMLAAEACKDNIDVNERLYKEWVQEGGFQHLNGFDPQYPSEAHPDDLPSNALGALFGKELKASGVKSSLRDSFSKFIRPLLPVPDSIAKKFSHRQIVMGLEAKAERAIETSRYIWFTAVPLNLTAKINVESRRILKKNFCIEASSIQSLRKAGFKVLKYKMRAIVIQRL